MDKKVDFAGEPYHLEYQKVVYKGPYFHQDVLELLFVMRGDLSIEIEGQKFLLQKGEYICINTGMAHTIHAGEKTYIISLYLDLNYFEKKYPFVKAANHFTVYNKNTDTDLDQFHAIRNYLIRLMMIESLQIPMRSALSIELCEIILDILIYYIRDDVYLKKKLSDVKSVDKERMMSISMFIHDNFSKKGFSLAELASSEHLSTTRLSHFWKEMTNMSFKETINQSRFMKAKRLLMDGELPISKIAEDCGYSDEKYLYKTIKDAFGMTPSEFRKAHKEILTTPNDYTLLDAKERLAEIIEYSSDFYRRIQDFSFLNGRFDEVEERNLNELYTVITTVNRKILNNEELVYDKIVLDLGLNSGLRLQNGEFVVNWEYIYALGHITIKLLENCFVAIDIELMSNEKWLEIINTIEDMVHERWSSEFMSRTTLLVTYKGYDKLSMAREFASSIKKQSYFANARPILFMT